jgi:peptide/nickel transport system substrate-binding protein
MLAVLERLLSGRRRTRQGGGHSSHRTATRMLAASALILSMLLAGVAAGTSTAGAAGAKKKITFTVGLITEVDSFNPFAGYEAPAYEAWALTYDYMTDYSAKDMSPIPALATSWETSKDGLTWTFHIRQGVKWSDGKSLTAHDIAYTYNRVLHGAFEGLIWESYLASVKTVTAPDDKTVVLKLSRPNAVLPLLPIPIVPEHIYKSISEKEIKTYAAEPTPGHPVVGSGPFRFVSGTAGGSTYRFEANPHYWKGAPHVDEVVFRVYQSDDPMVQALIKGEIDFAEDIKALQVRALQNRHGITAHNGDSPIFEEIAFNSGSINVKTGKPMGDPNPAVLDPKFRHALGYAVDRDLIVKKAYQGAAQPGNSVVLPAYKDYYWKPPKSEAYTFDLKKAGELLDEAGYKKGSDGLRTLPNGKPIGTLRLFARSAATESVDTMDYLKEWLSELGIQSEVTAMDSGKLSDVILSGDFDLFQWDWYVEPDPDSILDDMTCGQRGGFSDSWYCNPAYDKLYREQRTEMDRAKRIQIVKHMQQILYKDAPYLVTVYATTGEAVRSDKFACFQPQPEPGGVWLIQYGGANYLNLRPAADAGDCDGLTDALGATTAAHAGGSSAGTLIGGAAVLVLLFVGGGVFMLRRRSSAGERE